MLYLSIFILPWRCKIKYHGDRPSRKSIWTNLDPKSWFFDIFVYFLTPRRSEYWIISKIIQFWVQNESNRPYTGPFYQSYSVFWHIMSYLIISYDIISYAIISYDILSYDIISYDIIWYHIISYDKVRYFFGHAPDMRVNKISCFQTVLGTFGLCFGIIPGV